jgi:hypothetical protein
MVVSMIPAIPLKTFRLSFHVDLHEIYDPDSSEGECRPTVHTTLYVLTISFRVLSPE